MMTELYKVKQHWLDRISISMAVVFGIHFMVTNLLLVALPILATAFWVDEMNPPPQLPDNPNLDNQAYT